MERVCPTPPEMMKRMKRHRMRHRRPVGSRSTGTLKQMELTLTTSRRPQREPRPCNPQLLRWCLDRIRHQITQTVEESRREKRRREAERLAAVTAQRALLPWAPRARTSGDAG